MNTYSSPALQVIGSVETLTRATGNPNQADSIFNQGVLAGPGPGGSLDACVAPDPANPTSTCL